MLIHPVGLQIDVEANDAVALLRLTGELDADSAGGLMEAGDRIVAAGHRHVTLDCAAVTFCDSFGLRAMTQLWLRVQPDGSVTIVNPSDLLVRILGITGLAERFQIDGAPT